MTALLGSRGTSQAGQPTWWASLAVRSASLPCPLSTVGATARSSWPSCMA